MNIIRETSGYQVFEIVREPIARVRSTILIKAKEKGVTKPEMRLFLGRKWDLKQWEYLGGLRDTEFNGACCLEYGIGAFKK